MSNKTTFKKVLQNLQDFFNYSMIGIAPKNISCFSTNYIKFKV